MKPPIQADPEYPWLQGLLADFKERICIHGRPLSICAQCAPEAERRYADRTTGNIVLHQHR
jgi:hypothetical protein